MSQRTRKFIVRLSRRDDRGATSMTPQNYSCQSKARMMATPTDILNWKGDSHGVPCLDKELKTANDWQRRESFPRMRLPIGYLIPTGQPWNHIDKATLNRLRRFYLYINACIRTVTIREKETISLRVGWKGQGRGLREEQDGEVKWLYFN